MLRTHRFRALRFARSADHPAELVRHRAKPSGETTANVEAELAQLRDVFPQMTELALRRALLQSSSLEAAIESLLEGNEAPSDLRPFLRIQSILRRSAPAVSSGKVRLGACTFDMGRRELRKDNAIVRLTTIEANLLTTLARNPSVAHSREDLMNRCRIDGGERTVDVQVNRLRAKIESDPREPRFLQTLRGQGYALYPD